MNCPSVTVALMLTCAVAVAQEAFEVDPNSAQLQELARPMELDLSAYGCGPLEQPGITYYVAPPGDDAADGRSPQGAWRTVAHGAAKLRAGDTLVIAEGEYIESVITIGAEDGNTGEPGRPITITAAPRARVIITGGLKPELERVSGTDYTSAGPCSLPGGEAAVWESDTQILLQRVAGPEMVEELPGTWWYDAEAGTIHVHFSDSRGPDVHGISVRPGRDSTSNFRSNDDRGLDLRASYVRLRGLHFRNYHTGVLITGVAQGEDEDRTYLGGDHITIERCSFSSSTYAGLLLWAGARWNLMRENYGALNGARGSMLVNHKDAGDNLFMDNRFDSSAPTIREGGWSYHYGISTYGFVGRRNHIIGNVTDDVHSFRSKYTFMDSVLERNVMTGACSTVPCVYADLTPDDLMEGPQDRVIFRNNVFLGSVATSGQPMHESGPGGNWCDRYKCFVNNFAPGDDRAASIEAARFADPAWLDFRLQSDSPLRGAGIGGLDIGAFPEGSERVLYVAPDGDDAKEGTSDRQPLRTLPHAASILEPGDTLYIAPGAWAEPLAIEASGTEEQPITIRARARAEVTLPGVSVAGSHVVLEGLTVSDGPADGIAVSGDAVTVRECVVRGCEGAAVRATGAGDLSVEHCTLTGNTVGLALEAGCSGATVRDSLIAGNRDAQLTLADDARGSFLASHNCWSGPGVDAERVVTEVGSLVADPGFVGEAGGDLRLQWDSPAAHRALYARPAGALPALDRVPEIEGIEVAAVSSDTAIVTWTTPRDDTTATVSFRTAGAEEWRSARRDALGTVHGIGLAGLQPDTQYEFRITAASVRGGRATSEVRELNTAAEPRAPLTFHVSPDGDDAADGRSAETAWRTLRRASFAVMAGDTVLIAPGVYHHAIAPLCGGTADRRITFRREGEGLALIDGRSVVAPLVDLPDRDYVTVEGLVFDNLPPAGHPGVISARSSDGFELLNCRIGWSRPHGGFGNAVQLVACNAPRVEGNVIWGTRYHVVLYGSPGAVVRNNTMSFGQVFSIHVTGDHTGTRIAGNILYRPTSVPNAAIAITNPDTNLGLTSDYNCWAEMVEGTRPVYVYWSSLHDLKITGATVEEWAKNSGLDAHSIEADPLFVDVQRGDFRLQADSPAIGAGEGGLNMGAQDEMILRGRGE